MEVALPMLAMPPAVPPDSRVAARAGGEVRTVARVGRDLFASTAAQGAKLTRFGRAPGR